MKNNWPTKKLGEIAPFFRGQGLSKKDMVSSGAHKCILYGQLYTVYGPVIDDVVGRTDKEGRMLSVIGDVLIPGTTTADEVGIAVASALNEAQVVLGSDINIIRTKNKLLNSKFLSYLLSGPFKMRMAKYARGTNIIHLSGKDIAKIEVPVPPMQIQKQIVKRLDKIANAQKLNNELIQKTDELFQSLLHKELNPSGNNWEEDKFVNCIEKNPLKIKGIPREKYQSFGKFPIIDQSDKFIIGYTDNEDKVYKIDSPVIIFGDHTRIFKYIDFNFAIGADGTQIIIPDRQKIIPKFFYFSMLNLKINNLGYSRHFKLLKTKKIIVPPIKIQKQIVVKLSAVQDYKKQLLEQKSKLKELFDSVLSKSMKN